MRLLNIFSQSYTSNKRRVVNVKMTVIKNMHVQKI